METDPRVCRSLGRSLPGKTEDAVARIARRLAVFSDPRELSRTGEVRLKSKLWGFLDEAIAGGVTTLYTGLSYGADSAAAELFAERKRTNPGIRIVHVPAAPDWMRRTDPALRPFAALTLRQAVDFTKVLSCGESARDRLVIGSCLHIVLVTDLSDPGDDSCVWRILDEALTARPGSIPHQIHIIGCEKEERKNIFPAVKTGPVQGSLF